MLLVVLLLAWPVVFVGIVTASARDEAKYADTLCRGTLINWTLPDGTREDSLSDTHAIEVDFTRKWAEAIRRAFTYAAVVLLKPALGRKPPARAMHTNSMKRTSRR